MLRKLAYRAAGAALGAILLVGPAAAAETYYFDQGHTEVFFGWSHSGVSMQHAEFTKVDGKLSLDPDKPESSKISVTIDVDSVSSGVPIFNDHLRGEKWFDAAKYPTITFESTGIKRTGDKTAEVTGDLTIRDVTKPVTLQVELTHRGEHPVGKFLDYYKGDWVAFAAKTEIDHTAFNVGNFSTGPIFIEINTEMKDRPN